MVKGGEVVIRTVALVCTLLCIPALGQNEDSKADADFSAELPRIKPVEPENALQTFTVHPDFELQLVAHEPNVVDPVAACFDAYGRLYVVEMRGYSEQRDEKLGRIRRLEDRDNDGVFETSKIFADGLQWPTAIAPYDNGVFVIAAPHIYYLKDGLLGRADGDGADKMAGGYPIILTGLKHTNVQGLANSMRWGIDGRIHVATSSSGAEVKRPDRDRAPGVVLRGRDFSFDPRIVWQVLPLDDMNPRMGWGDAEWEEERERLIQRTVAQGFEHEEATQWAAVKIREAKRAVAFAKTKIRYSRSRSPSIRPESGGGQHGMCFDDHFRKFVCQNSDHIQFVRYEDRYAARASNVVAPASRRSIAVDGPQAEVFRLSDVEPWRVVRTRLRVAGIVGGPIEGGGRAAGYFTGATGTTIYRGHNWPKEYRGQAFIGDVGSNIVHRKILEPDGLGFRANRARDGVEFIASTDTWFRPVQFLNGPDGNLYVLDMYRETIEHPKSLPPQIKRHLDLTSGRDRGRIYRVVSKKTKRKGALHPAAIVPRKLVKLLDSPNAWDRETAARLLFEKQSELTIGPLRKLVRIGTPLGRLSALRALDNVRLSLDEASLLVALNDEDPCVREHAVRLAESRMQRWPTVRKRVASLADDPNIHVRAQVAFSSHKLEDELVPVVTSTLKRDGQNEVIRFAAIASSEGNAMAVLSALVDDSDFRQSPVGSKVLSMLSDLAAKKGKAAGVLQLALSLPEEERTLATKLLAPVSKIARATSTNPMKQSLNEFADRAAMVLADQARSDSERVAACKQVLFHSNRDRVAARLLTVVEPTQPQPVQLAAIDALGQLPLAQIARQCIGKYDQLTPAVQQAITDTLLTREPWAELLLTAIVEHKLPAHTITASRLQRLRNSRSKTLNKLVQTVAKNSQTTARATIVKQWQDVLQMSGDAKEGRNVFRKNCANCHRLEGFGEQLGPGLAAIRNRGIDAVLMNILDPNRELNPQYSSYAILTNDGRSISGMIANETASGITLKNGEKINVTVQRDDIDEIRNTGLSLMPEGLEKDISKQQMADLLRYLTTVKQ